jgi:hypothetical protein
LQLRRIPLWKKSAVKDCRNLLLIDKVRVADEQGQQRVLRRVLKLAVEWGALAVSPNQLLPRSSRTALFKMVSSNAYH